MSDSAHEPHAQQTRPNFLERLRQALGINSPSLRDDIEDALDQAEPGDEFSAHERAILRNVLGLHEHRVNDIMVPRADIVAIGVDASLGDVLKLFRTAGHSRLPVHGDTLDDPKGMVHIRDFVDHVAGFAEADAKRGRGAGADASASAAERRTQRLASLGAIDLSAPLARAGIIRPVLFVPPSMPALDLLVKMQASRTHMALVIDEYGGTDGLVSIEDVVEMIVGDIEDEHDLNEDPVIQRLSDREFLIDARADLVAVSRETGLDLTRSSESEDVETLAGLITTVAGRVPARGEVIRYGPLPIEFEVVDADPRRVNRVRLRLQAESLFPEAGDDAGARDRTDPI
ncbi:MAG: hemolysin family protein [Beijerinckiaceae bacterium]|mgnify:CR=1 FL=1